MKLIDKTDRSQSLRKQCDMLSVNRSRLYYSPAGESRENLDLMDKIDAHYTDRPTTGVLGMVNHLALTYGEIVNPKRVRRLMRLMALMAIYPKKRTSIPNADNKVYPCLLKHLKVFKPNHVWCTDITYIRLLGGFMYLVVLMDLFSRFVLSWRISNSMDLTFCLDALDEALRFNEPEIHHSDQGCQYTSKEYTGVLSERGINISMSGRGRCFDNIFNERLWRSYKQEEVYIKDYSDGHDLYQQTERYFDYYNYRRPHQGLGGLTPAMVYGGNEQVVAAVRDLDLRSKATGSSHLLRRFIASPDWGEADAEATKHLGLKAQVLINKTVAQNHLIKT